jgi:hypothetical protein
MDSKLTKEAVLERLQYEIDHTVEQLEKWKEKFVKNPAYACEWGDETFQLAAALRVMRELEEVLQNKKTELPNILKQAQKRVQSMSLYPKSSTSDCSNIMHKYELKAWANFIDKFLEG